LKSEKKRKIRILKSNTRWTELHQSTIGQHRGGSRNSA